MLRSMVVLCAVLGSSMAYASPGRLIVNAVQDQKAVGGFGRGGTMAVQDQKAVGGFGRGGTMAVQDQKSVGTTVGLGSVSSETSIETIPQPIDLNEGF